MHFFSKYVCFEYLRFLEVSKRAEFVSKVYLCNEDTLDGLKEFAENNGLCDKDSPYYCGELPAIKKKAGMVDNCTLFVGSKYLSGRKLATLCSNMCKSCIYYSASGKAEERYERICVAALYKEEYNRKSTRLDARFRTEQVFVFEDKDGRPGSIAIKVGKLLFTIIKGAFDDLTRNDTEKDAEYLSERILSIFPSVSDETGTVKRDLKRIVTEYLRTEYNELSVNSAVASLMAPVRRTPRSRIEPPLPGQVSLFDVAGKEEGSEKEHSKEEEKTAKLEAKPQDSVIGCEEKAGGEGPAEDVSAKDGCKEDEAGLLSEAPKENAPDEPDMKKDASKVPEHEGEGGDEHAAVEEGLGEDVSEPPSEADASLEGASGGEKADGSEDSYEEAKDRYEESSVKKEESKEPKAEAYAEASDTAKEGGEQFFVSLSEGVCLSSTGSGSRIARISANRVHSLFRLLYDSRLVSCEAGRLDGEKGLFILGDNRFEYPVFAGEECLKKEFFQELLGTDKYTVVTVNYELLCEFARMYGYAAEGNAASIGAAYRAVCGGDEVYPFRFISEYAGEGASGAGFERYLDAYVPAYAELLKEILEKEKYKAFKNNMFFEYVLGTSSYMGGALTSRQRNILRTSFCGCSFSYQHGMRKALPGIIYTCSFKETETVKKNENFLIVLSTRIFKRYPFDKCHWNLLSVNDSEISFFVRGHDAEAVGIIRERIGLAVADTCRALDLPPITYIVEVE